MGRIVFMQTAGSVTDGRGYWLEGSAGKQTQAALLHVLAIEFGFHLTHSPKAGERAIENADAARVIASIYPSILIISTI